MTTTATRAEINRRNAALSTWPKSAEGKSRVRLNALKHGLTAATLVVHFTINGRVAALIRGGQSRLARVPGDVALAAASLLASRCNSSNRSYFVNFQANGLGCSFVSSS